MKVLAVGNFYPPRHLGGYEVIWQGVSRALRQAGHSTRILTTDYRASEEGVELDPDVHRELEFYWREHEWRALGPMRRLALERANARVFERHVREFAPDVIAWWALGGMSLGLVERARRLGLPGVFFVLDYWLEYGLQHDLWLRMVRRAGRARPVVERITGLPADVDFGRAGRWLFCSETMREHARAVAPSISDGEILTPGVAEEMLAAPRDPAPKPWRWRLLYLGRVVEQKGVRTAVEAIAHLPEQAELRIVGEGDARYRGELDRVAETLGVASRVRFEPARGRDEVLAVYRDADAVIFPVSWAEPWGLVPLEAMALGRPVLATGLGGSGDYLRDGVNALIFPAGDTRALAEALTRLAGDPGLRERLLTGGYDTAAAHGEAEFDRRAVAELARAAGRSDQ